MKPVSEGHGVGGLGLGFTPFETRPEVILRSAQLADRCGFDSVGLAEASGHAAPLLLAEVALTTEHLELATSVLSVWSRSPAVLAMTAIGLQRASAGRFVLGLGASTPPLVEGLHGVTWQDPIGRLRAVLRDVRDLLAGRRLGQVPDGARPLALATPSGSPVPLALASLSPPTVRLAGELVDRWVPFLWPLSQLHAGRRLLAEGASQVDRADLPAVTPSVPLAVGPDRASAASAAARWLLVYCTRMGPIYPRMLRERFGYAAEVDALLAANTGRDAPPTLPAASVRLADDVLILATHDEVPEAVRRWADAGADRVDLILPFGTGEEELRAAVLAAAPTPATTTGQWA